MVYGDCGCPGFKGQFRRERLWCGRCEVPAGHRYMLEYAGQRWPSLPTSHDLYCSKQTSYATAPPPSSTDIWESESWAQLHCVLLKNWIVCADWLFLINPTHGFLNKIEATWEKGCILTPGNIVMPNDWRREGNVSINAIKMKFSKFKTSSECPCEFKDHTQGCLNSFWFSLKQKPNFSLVCQFSTHFRSNCPNCT